MTSSSSLVYVVYLLLFSLPTTAFAAKCAAPPLNLPYRNVSITPGVLTYGIPIHIGSPWQSVALTPSLQLDNTFIPRFTNTCVHNDAMPMSSNNATRRSIPLVKRKEHPGSFEENSSSDGAGKTGWEGDNWWVQCSELYGGGYAPELSSSFHDNGTNDQVRESWLKTAGFSDWHFVTEQFVLADYLDVYARTNEALPEKTNLTTSFILPDAGALFGGMGASALGITPNSTLLRALHDVKMIPSTSWTLTNSSLCLGCTDANAHTSDFQSFKPADRAADSKLPCLIQAKVEALNWHPKKGVEGATLIQDTFTACIDPGVKFLVLPDDARDAFKEIVERDVKGEYEDYIAFKGPPKEDVGILTFRLEGGLVVNVTVPGVGRVGAEEVGEWKVPIGRGGWGAYGNQTWTLGKPFTDRVVIKWDEGAKEYGIANLNDDPSRKEDIQPLGCDEFPKVEKIVTSSPGTGVLVGSVIGGFVGGLVFAMAGLWFFKRGEKGVKSKYEPLEETLPMTRIPTDRRTMDSAMSGALSPPSVRESMRSQMGSRSASPMAPQLVADNSIYEAPEGGTAYPTKRERPEMSGLGLR